MSAGTLDGPPRNFDLPGSLRRQQRRFALGAFAVVGLLVAGMLFAQEFREEPALLALTAGLVAIFSGLGLRCLHLARTHRYGVEIGPDGVRPLQQGPAGWISWGEIAELRERPVLQRVDLCSPGGEVRASLEYQLENFDEALAAVVAGVRPAPHLETPGGRLEARTVPGLKPLLVAIFAGALAFGVWSFAVRGDALPLLLPVVLAGATLADLFLQVRTVEVRDTRLLLHAPLRRSEIDLSRVESVRLRLRELGRGQRLLDLEIRFRSGETRLIRPAGFDPFALRRTVATALNR